MGNGLFRHFGRYASRLSDEWKGDVMSRFDSKTIVFRKPFHIDGVEGLFPAGSYTVETEHEAMPGLNTVVYRRIATTITLPVLHGVSQGKQVVSISDDNLRSAMLRDSEDE